MMVRGNDGNSGNSIHGVGIGDNDYTDDNYHSDHNVDDNHSDDY